MGAAPVLRKERDELGLGERIGYYLLLGYGLAELILKVSSRIRYKW